MATGKRYYWIKLKKDFLSSDAIEFLMSHECGSDYVVLYLQLCTATINTAGRLESHIGEMIVQFDVDRIQREGRYFPRETVERALELYKRIGLIYEDRNGTLVIENYSDMVGSETDYANQKRNQRARVDNGVDNVHTDTRDQIPEYRDQIPEERERTPTTTDSTYMGETAGGGAGGGDFPPDILAYAREAARGANNPAAYEAAILERIREAGFKTIEEVRAADEDRRKRPANPTGPVYMPTRTIFDKDAQPKRIGEETIL